MTAIAISPPAAPERSVARAYPQPSATEPVIDLVHLARATDGDESLEAELMAMFDRQSEKLVGRVKMTDLPRRARADIAHRLRGSALAIGAFAVARAAEALEATLEADGEPQAEIAALAEAVAVARATIAELSKP
jgi:HPt (histidine-containing phosphotransfer) domain-containing protein